MEVVFDVERERHFQNRPSRIGSVHLFRDIESTRAFARNFRSPDRPYIYLCSSDQGARFDTDMEWINAGVIVGEPLEPQLEAMRGRAANYWSGLRAPSSPYAETFVAGQVTVARLVETIALP